MVHSSKTPSVSHRQGKISQSPQSEAGRLHTKAEQRAFNAALYKMVEELPGGSSLPPIGEPLQQVNCAEGRSNSRSGRGGDPARDLLKTKSTWKGSFNDKNGIYAALSYSMQHSSIDEHFHLLEMFSDAIEQGFLDRAIFDQVLEAVNIENMEQIGLGADVLKALARSTRHPETTNTTAH